MCVCVCFYTQTKGHFCVLLSCTDNLWHSERNSDVHFRFYRSIYMKCKYLDSTRAVTAQKPGGLQKTSPHPPLSDSFLSHPQAQRMLEWVLFSFIFFSSDIKANVWGQQGVSSRGVMRTGALTCWHHTPRPHYCSHKPFNQLRGSCRANTGCTSYLFILFRFLFCGAPYTFSLQHFCIPLIQRCCCFFLNLQLEGQFLQT